MTNKYYGSIRTQDSLQEDAQALQARLEQVKVEVDSLMEEMQRMVERLKETPYGDYRPYLITAQGRFKQFYYNASAIVHDAAKGEIDE